MFGRLNRYWRALREGRSGYAAAMQAPASSPADALAMAAQAAQHLAREEREDARDCYEAALAHDADCVAARLGLARMLREAGAGEAALEHVRHALFVAPGDAAAHFESALVRNRCGDAQGALAAYQRVLELAPDHAAAASNAGLICLSQLGDAPRARQYFARAIAIDPGLIAAQVNLGLALDELGQSAAALAHFERLVAADPAQVEYRWHRGLILLGGGDYARGWEDYEMRNERSAGAAPRAFPFPVWQGGELRPPAALLVYAEQGMGDEIMFASCVPDLLQRGLRCVIECDPRLATVFARSFPAALVHGAPRDGDRGWLASYPELETQIAIGSLPRLLRRSVADFPHHGGYLAADAGRAAQWRARLAAKSIGRAVGIAWGGGTAKTRRDLRTVPLGELAPVFRQAGSTFVCLQRDAGPALAELASAQDASLLAFEGIPDDVDDTAALLQALDAVVTADNTLAHLAGALGRPTWVMLPHHADWRWQQALSTTCWYPSVTLCRQPRAGDWAGAVAQVVAGLNALLRC